jgi:regulator of replication initiation timing
MKNIGQVFLKYSEQVVNKTDNFTQMAKINIEIKKALSDIEDAKTRIGDYIAGQHELKNESVLLNDNNISVDLQFISDLKAKIDELKKNLEEIKKKKAPQHNEEEPEDDNKPESENK